VWDVEDGVVTIVNPFVLGMQRNIKCSKLLSIPAPLCITMLQQTNHNYVIRMMPLPLLMGMQNGAICHGGWISSWRCACK
jgi:hypothetical protein